MRLKDPEIAECAVRGELPPMGWKGGVASAVEEEKKGAHMKPKKYGTLYYLAQWQGIRGDDLDIDMSQEVELTCSKTGVKVIFTGDYSKYAKA
jgi:hypothetical protein